MKKRLRSKISSAPKVDPYLEGLMAKLLERLGSLDRKMDAVLTQAVVRPIANGEQNQQPPRRDRVLYEAICADCSKVCEVPFRPTESRPVYCKECWGKRKAGGNGPVFPVLTPVALPPKPQSKIFQTPQPAPIAGKSKKAKKSVPVKKAKKKK